MKIIFKELKQNIEALNKKELNIEDKEDKKRKEVEDLEEQKQKLVKENKEYQKKLADVSSKVAALEKRRGYIKKFN